MNKQEKPRTIIVGVGNLLLKDEGIGIHAARALQEAGLSPEVEIIDGGTSPDFVSYVRKDDTLVIIDAVKAGGEPGEVYRFTPEDVEAQSHEALSLHELGVMNSLRMMRLGGSQPRKVVIIGVEPEEIAPGLELTSCLAKVLPRIVELARQECPG